MSTPEGEASKIARIRASELGMRLFRNNTGVLKNQDGIPVRYGLGNESQKLVKERTFGDYVGITPIVITPEMVGSTVGVFSMLEMKAPDTLVSTIKKANNHPQSREAAQFRAIKHIRELGGMAWFASCEHDVDVIYRLYLEGLKK